MYFSIGYYNTAWPEAQADALYDHGKFIDRYWIDNKTMILYGYSTFYIEVEYCNVDNEIKEYKGISAEEAADKYVEEAIY